MRKIWMLLTLSMLLIACSSSGQEPDGDTADGDEPALDGDQAVDGDLDPEPAEDGDDSDTTKEEEEEGTDGDELDGDLIEFEFEREAEQEVECENGPDALCFDLAPPGTSGTKCTSLGEQQILVYCEPSLPTPPRCVASACDCKSQKVCEGACLDNQDGAARCEEAEFEGDTDLERDIDSDGSEIDDLDGESDGDEEPDLDGDIVDWDENEGDAEEETAPCVNDAYEPNEGLGSARSLSAGPYSLTLCPDDDDWFKVELTPNDMLTATLSFDPADGNLDLYLMNRDAGVVQISNGSGSIEEVSVIAEYAGPYYLFVFSIDNRTANYSLSVSVDIHGSDEDEEILEVPEVEVEKEELVTCEDDELEPNSSREGAAPVAAIRYDDLIRCENDDDFYRVELKTNDYLSISIFFYNPSGNLDLYVIHPDGHFISNQVSTTNNETASITATADGTYLIRVLSPSNDENVYDMEITITPWETCQDDGHEDNDSFETAKGMAAGDYESLRLCPFDSDWYSFELDAGQAIGIELDFSHYDGNIDGALFSHTGEILDLGNSTTDNENLVYNAPEARTVYLQVFSYGSLELDYDMSASIVDGPLCDDDIFEPNNSFAEAHAMEQDGQWPTLSLCSQNEDWYRFELNSDNYLTAKVFYDHQTTPFQLMLLNENEQELAYHRYLTNDNQVIIGAETYIQAQSAGSYSLMVRSVLPVDNTYELEVSVCPEDDLEPNDDYLHSTYIDTSETGQGEFVDRAICRGNEDWYAADIYVGQRLRILLSFDGAQGDLDLFMRDGFLNVVRQSTTTTSDEVIDFILDQTGSYYFQVTGYEDAENVYTLYYLIEDVKVPETSE